MKKRNKQRKLLVGICMWVLCWLSANKKEEKRKERKQKNRKSKEKGFNQRRAEEERESLSEK